MAIMYQRTGSVMSLYVKNYMSLANMLSSRTLTTSLHKSVLQSHRMLTTGGKWQLSSMMSGLDTSKSDHVHQSHVYQSFHQQKCMYSDYNPHDLKQEPGQKKPDFSQAKNQIMENFGNVQKSPGPALAIGLAGLVPFFLMPGAMIVTGQFVYNLAFSQAAYSACILSFLGAVRWGMAMSENKDVPLDWYNLGYSVTPVAVSWLSLLMPLPLGLVTLTGTLAGVAYMDLTLPGYPEWFKALRFLLTGAAILAMWTTLLCWLVLTDSRKKKEQQLEKALKEKNPQIKHGGKTANY